MSTISGLMSDQGFSISTYTTRTGAPICGAAIARPLPNRDCQSRRVSRKSSRITRTAVELGRVIGWQRVRRIGSPRRRMRWMVMGGSNRPAPGECPIL
jgi:hypothetical protein